MVNFKDYNNKELKKISKLSDKILDLEEIYTNVTDEFIQNKTSEFKKRIETGQVLDEILIEVFAICREAIYRVLGKKLYKVQIMGAIAVHQGRIVEMKTGEGKTLTQICPAYLNALEGKGVHIATVNDYLAKRDMNEAKLVFEYLKLTVGLIIDESNEIERREAYNCDITYITNNEIGFDFLKDNMITNNIYKVQRELNFVILDEVDSILIDEARSPLVISQDSEEKIEIYFEVNNFVKNLEKEDYCKDEKKNTIILSEVGIKKAEIYFSIDNIATIEHGNLNYYIDQSLRAHYIMIKDKDYLIKNKQILIIDEFTGRICEGRRFAEGLHQAIEAKEDVEIQSESKTLGTITYQNLFRQYKKLSGMTGTGKSEEREFKEIYQVDVIVIPTNKPIVRKDNEDKVYLNEKIKITHIIEDIINTHKQGRPVLICTPSIQKSEFLSKKLKEQKIEHQLLNAKYHQQEAEIILKAGEKNKITIATNMVGRGTDIKISAEVNELGGLKVIGTERAFNRRIDNQLIGRAGRQGNNGESQFYVSLEDDLLRIFGFEKLKIKLVKQGFNQEDIIQNKFIFNQIIKAQKYIESMHYDERKETIKYDEVINKQRSIIYEQRNLVLQNVNLEQYISSMIKDLINNLVANVFEKNNCNKEDFDKENILHEKICIDIFSELIGNYINEIGDYIPYEKILKAEDTNQLLINLSEIISNIIELKIKNSKKDFENIEKDILLSIIDELWIEHLDTMIQLRKKVVNVLYKQQDPLQEYKLEGGILFEALIRKIRYLYIKEMIKLNTESIE